MVAARMRELTFAYDDGELLFGPITVSLEAGRYGLVGANGAGKSTLLSLIAGALAPRGGRLELSPPRPTVVFCPQEVDDAGPDVIELGERADRVAQRVRDAFALASDELARWTTLSPGERKRWQLGAAFAREPDVLLLDEPTNHLDTEGRAAVASALARLRALVIIVSHDRAFLDETTTATLRLHDRRLTITALPYSEARDTWQAERESAIATHALRRDELGAAKRRVDEAQRRVVASSRARYASARMKDRNDRDATDALASMRAQRSQTSTSQHAARARRSLEEARAALPAFEVDKTLGSSFFVSYSRPERPVLAEVTGELRRGNAVVLSDVTLRVHRDRRVRIAGENGAGKTTLLDALAASWTLPPQRLLHLPQELEPPAVARLRQTLLELAPAPRGRVLSCLAALGVDPAATLRNPHASPGEARKLAMALGLGREAWLLVLDEPTNHLDVPSIERLEAALARFPGALVLATHDERLAARVTSEVLELPSPRTRSPWHAPRP